MRRVLGSPRARSLGVRAPGSAQRSAVPARAGAATFSKRRPRADSSRAVSPGGGRRHPAACPAVPAGAQDFPAAPSYLPLPFGPLLRDSAFPAGPGGAMERAPGRLRTAFSGCVFESRAPGGPPNRGARGRGPSAEPGAPGADPAGAPHPAPKLPPCPGGAFLRSTSHPEERRALGVRPGPASSTLAAPGRPRDSARWMLCVAGAKLKVSGGGGGV